MVIKQAEFMLSVANADKLPTGDVREIAIAGKSNVGKSSLINTLVNNGKMAKTSSAPGRTRLLNYFSINKDEFRIVDLPGYGFAKVPGDEKVKWAKMMEGYFEKSRNLCHVFVLVDIRRAPGALDKQMIAFLHHYSVPFTVIATKCDKLSVTRAKENRSMIAKELALGEDNILLSSSLKKTGKDEIFDRMESVLKAAELSKI